MRIGDHILHNGALIPITGYRCAVCDLPLTPVFAQQRAHPTCFEKDEKE